MSSSYLLNLFFFFFNDTATTEIYTLSLHDALPIFGNLSDHALHSRVIGRHPGYQRSEEHTSELQSQSISYAVFCLKKKKKKQNQQEMTTKKKKRAKNKKKIKQE